MDPRIQCYLRTCRRTSGLTQQELAFLLGLASRSTVSRYERTGEIPSARLLIACEVVFRRHASELFPDLYERVNEEVVRRGNALFDELEAKEGDSPSAKRDLLLAMVASEWPPDNFRSP